MRKQHNIVGQHVVGMRKQHNIVGQHSRDAQTA